MIWEKRQQQKKQLDRQALQRQEQEMKSLYALTRNPGAAVLGILARSHGPIDTNAPREDA